MAALYIKRIESKHSNITKAIITIRENMAMTEKAHRNAVDAMQERGVKVIQTPSHKGELAKVSFVSSVMPTAIHIGSGGIQLYLDHGQKLGGRIAPTDDADVIASDMALAAVARNYGADTKDVQITANTRTRFGTGPVRKTSEMYPFVLRRLSTTWAPIKPLFESLDIFTETTGVCPIPVTNQVLKSGFATIQLEDAQVRVAKPFLLVATQLNPFASTDERISRISYVLIQTYHKNPEGYEGMIKKALDYINMGGQRADEMLAANPMLVTRIEFSQYDAQVHKIANIIAKNKKGMIRNAAQKLGLSSADADTVMQIVADNFSAYRTTRSEKTAEALASLRRPA